MIKMKREKGKRGQEITLGTIILIILGIAVLVFLIFGFSTGWSNFIGKINPFNSGENTEQVKQACSSACMMKGEYDYCTAKMIVKLGNGNKLTNFSCFQLSKGDKGITGIESCSEITCQEETPVSLGSGGVQVVLVPINLDENALDVSANNWPKKVAGAYG